MYQKDDTNQLKFEDFYLPFSGKLRSDNRWVILSKQILWQQKYGGMSPDMIKQLKAVQKENAQLKRLVADQALDISILKVAAEGNF